MNFPLFIDKDKLTKYGYGKPFFSFYLRKKPIKIHTEIPINFKYWNGEAVSTRDELHEPINNRLNEMRNFLRKTLITNPFITPDQLKLAFKENFFAEKIKKAPEPSELSFIQYCNEKLEDNNKIEPETKSAYRRGIDRLLIFDKKFNWGHLTAQGIKKYENYLHGYEYEEAGVKKKYSNPTIKRYLKTLRAFVNLAAEDKLIETNPFDTFKWGTYNKSEKQATRRREYLRPLEIEALINLKPIPEELAEAYDYAIIALHSGLAVKDMKQLNESMIKKYDYDGKQGLAIYKDRGKTEEPLYIPLFLINDGRAEEVVKRRIELVDGGNLFPSNEKTIRDKLKILTAKAGIDRNIGTHSLRHTFATWLLYKGVSLFVVKELMGHLKIETTEIYTHLDENHINYSLSKNQ